MTEATDRQIAATLIPGDGIGPEIVEIRVTILDALCAPLLRFEMLFCRLMARSHFSVSAGAQTGAFDPC